MTRVRRLLGFFFLAISSLVMVRFDELHGFLGFLFFSFPSYPRDALGGNRHITVWLHIACMHLYPTLDLDASRPSPQPRLEAMFSFRTRLDFLGRCSWTVLLGRRCY